MGSKVLKTAIAILLAAVFALLLFVPFLQRIGALGESYNCFWEDGTTSLLSYGAAYRALDGITEEGDVSLVRDGKRGSIASGEEAKHAYSLLREGDLAELLAYRMGEVSRIEKAALYRTFKDTLWYDEGESFVWTGEQFLPADFGEAKEIVLLGGSLTASRLARSGAQTLHLRPRAEFTYKTLLGTRVEVVASAPYSVEGGAVFLETAVGKRLLAGMPLAKHVEVDCTYIDEGALLPCEELESLTLPFVGSAANAVGTDFHGELAYLFSTGNEYRVPATLKRVRVTGGVLVSHAFYLCNMLEEIDACGVLAESIERDAFVDCTDLRLLHTPRADIELRGEYTVTTAPCGCTIYER